MATNPTRRAYVAQDLAQSDYAAILARNDTDAVIEACAEFGYGVQELAELRKGPWDVVRVVRARVFDRHHNLDNIPEERVASVARRLFALTTAAPTRLVQSAGEDESIEVPVAHDDHDGEIEL